MVILEASIEATSDHLEKLEDVSRCSCTFPRLCTGTTVEYVRYLLYGIYSCCRYIGIYPPRADHTELNAIHTSCLYSCFGFPIPKRAAPILAYTGIFPCRRLQELWYLYTSYWIWGHQTARYFISSLRE